MPSNLREYAYGNVFDISSILSEREREVLTLLMKRAFRSRDRDERDEAFEHLTSFTGTRLFFKIESIHMADSSYFALIRPAPHFDLPIIGYVGEINNLDGNEGYNSITIRDLER